MDGGGVFQSDVTIVTKPHKTVPAGTQAEETVRTRYVRVGQRIIHHGVSTILLPRLCPLRRGLPADARRCRKEPSGDDAAHPVWGSVLQCPCHGTPLQPLHLSNQLTAELGPS